MKCTLSVAVGLFLLELTARTAFADGLSKSLFLSDSRTGSVSNGRSADVPGPRNRSEIPIWLRSLGQAPGYVEPRQGRLEAEEEERAHAAKREVARLAGAQLEKMVKSSPLADVYEVAAGFVERSKSLVTLSGESPAQRSKRSDGRSSFAPSRKVALGADPLRAFSPVLSLGPNARVATDIRSRDLMFEWAFAF